jgi:hypothetical protein
MQVRCRLNGAETKLFTDGKVYKAYKELGKEYCRTWTLVDDLGHERVILPDQVCPHLNVYGRDAYGFPMQKPVGVFETVNDVV